MTARERLAPLAARLRAGKRFFAHAALPDSGVYFSAAPSCITPPPAQIRPPAFLGGRLQYFPVAALLRPLLP